VTPQKWFGQVVATREFLAEFTTWPHERQAEYLAFSAPPGAADVHVTRWVERATRANGDKVFRVWGTAIPAKDA
jgi:hypothetical protein